ncbi:hypothetical protein PCASD_10639 [Puccinia coronata f. sp. avenae]|uniref:DDE-1 domain-containing protein n=1 Tax=Puccinia coronata f. sp. avenae TaxID=200324 RepID=A0A2N5TEB8_9BASI|nr:hypothetical protein PCASD_10639 [Puccinia coronata f. sp. avenae]
MSDHSYTDPALTDPALLAIHASSSSTRISQILPSSPRRTAKNHRRVVAPSRPSPGIKKRAHTTLSEKLMIIDFIGDHPTWDQATVAKHFQRNGFPTLSQSTISRYIKDEERIRNLAQDPSKLHVKKQKQAQCPQILSCMEFWFYQALGQSPDAYHTLSLDAQKRKWKEFENLLAMRSRKRAPTPSSFDIFKHLPKRFRNPIDPRGTDPMDVAMEMDRLRHLTDAYPLEDILAMDEICLSYACPPSEPSSLHSMPKLTIALTCSADGSWKDDPVIVGQTPMHVAYPSADLTPETCGFRYHWNTKAVMTCAIWEKYLLDLDETCGLRDRRVLLLVDVSHVHLLPDPPLANIQIEYIDTARMFGVHPSNPPCNPFAAGITTYFKSEYRVRFCLRALSSDEFGLLDLYNLDQAAATRIIQDAWNCVTPAAISHIFRRSGVVSSRSDDDDSQFEECKEGDMEDGPLIHDPAIEQSIANLTMCLAQLTIKVMNLTDQTEMDEAREPTPVPSETDQNINPELMAQAAEALDSARTQRRQSRQHKKPAAEQIVNAHEFIEIDVGLPTELFWDTHEIVEQVSREGAGTFWPVIGRSSSPRRVWNLDDPQQHEDSPKTRKRGVGAMTEHGDIMVAEQEPAATRRRHVRARTESEMSSPPEPPIAGPSNSNIFEQPVGRREEPGSGGSGHGQQQQQHQQQQQYTDLSRFSQQISNLESLRVFCTDLVVHSADDDFDGAARRRRAVVQHALPTLLELEDEFKALEAADLLRLVSG